MSGGRQHRGGTNVSRPTLARASRAHLGFCRSCMTLMDAIRHASKMARYAGQSEIWKQPRSVRDDEGVTYAYLG